MEKLHDMLGSNDRAPDIIGPVSSGPPESLDRLVVNWRRQSSCLRWEEDLPIENLPFPFDLDYQDSADFRPDADAHLDGDFGRFDSDLQDPEPATALPDYVFDDLETIDRSQTQHSTALDHALEPEDRESVTALFTSLSRPRLDRETLRFLALGLAVHLVVLSLFVTVPSPSLSGFAGISDKPISVKLTEKRQIDTPVDPAPAAMDSAASMAALARREPEPEKTRIREETEKEMPTEVESKEETEKARTAPRLADVQPTNESVAAHPPVPLEASLHGPPNDSKSSLDSVASLPSVASPQREGTTQSGDEAQTYKDRILSAISQAAYYPRAALRNKAHGRTLVSFTINKDGSLAKVSIAHHARSRALDEAALKIVEKASSHFPPIPASLMKEQANYVVPIVFKKRR